MSKINNIPEIPAEKFRFVGINEKRHDQKFQTKQISYFRDAFNRFCKNKSSVVAAIIIFCLILYAIFVPIFCETSYSLALTDTTYLKYTKLAPRNQLCVDLGFDFWDGCSVRSLGEQNLVYMKGITAETGHTVVKEIISEAVDSDGKVMYKLPETVKDSDELSIIVEMALPCCDEESIPSSSFKSFSTSADTILPSASLIYVLKFISYEY